MVTHDSGLTMIMGSTSWLSLAPRMGIHFVHKHLEVSVSFCSNLYTFNSYLSILANLVFPAAAKNNLRRGIKGKISHSRILSVQ